MLVPCLIYSVLLQHRSINFRLGLIRVEYTYLCFKSIKCRKMFHSHLAWYFSYILTFGSSRLKENTTCFEPYYFMLLILTFTLTFTVPMCIVLMIRASLRCKCPSKKANSLSLIVKLLLIIALMVTLTLVLMVVWFR